MTLLPWFLTAVLGALWIRAELAGAFHPVPVPAPAPVPTARAPRPQLVRAPKSRSTEAEEWEMFLSAMKGMEIDKSRAGRLWESIDHSGSIEEVILRGLKMQAQQPRP